MQPHSTLTKTSAIIIHHVHSSTVCSVLPHCPEEYPLIMHVKFNIIQNSPVTVHMMFTPFSSFQVSSLVNVCNGRWKSAGQGAHLFNQFVYHLTTIHISSNGATVATLTGYHILCRSLSPEISRRASLSMSPSLYVHIEPNRIAHEFNK